MVFFSFLTPTPCDCCARMGTTEMSQTWSLLASSRPVLGAPVHPTSPSWTPFAPLQPHLPAGPKPTQLPCPGACVLVPCAWTFPPTADAPSLLLTGPTVGWSLACVSLRVPPEDSCCPVCTHDSLSTVRSEGLDSSGGAGGEAWRCR